VINALVFVGLQRAISNIKKVRHSRAGRDFSSTEGEFSSMEGEFSDMEGEFSDTEGGFTEAYRTSVGHGRKQV
jgi:hypothetical protein